ncbi:MAG: transcription termination factor Rho, partial [Rhodothermales bacterium]|nr:transcription termination factor Rho [Rhodothermales bacterium]
MEDSKPRFSGILELIGDKKFGFIRGLRADVPKGKKDPFVPPP